MKKALTLTITLVICMFTLTYGGKVKEDKARQVAQNWYRHFAPNAKSLAEITHTKEYKWGDRTSFYIYSFDKGGFVLVSANDAVSPILGYGFDHPVPDIITNEAVKAWFDGYARQIDTAFVLNLRSEEMVSQWQQVLDNKFPAKSGNSVGPLLTTTWNQGWPYNALCPADSNGPGGHAIAGCVSVALAQIMKYHNWPSTGYDTVAYNFQGLIGYWPYGNIGANFGNSSYNWQNMPNALSGNNNDVAKLIFHAGISVKSTYNSNATGAYTSKGVDALVRFFKYAFSDIEYLIKDTYEYTDMEWTLLMKGELDSLRPILYRGEGNAGGHAFVCDGYDQTGFYHFNFGWGGLMDGYYIISNLSPHQFNDFQGMIVGIKPNDGSTVLQDQTWSGNVSIDKKRIILDHVKLTILPGTNVVFNPRSSLMIAGALEANGTSTDSIYFTAVDTMQRWNGLSIQKGNWHENDYLSLSYCSITYSNHGGINITGLDQFFLSHCYIGKNKNFPFTTNNSANMYVGACGDAWLGWPGGGPSRGGGIHVSESYGEISGCKISQNWAYGFGGGVFIGNSAGAANCDVLFVENDSINKVRLSNNIIDSNSSGIVGGGVCTFSAQVLISDNTINFNNSPQGGAVALYNVQSDSIKYYPLILSNFIHGNSGYNGSGIYLLSSDALIVNNVLSNNGMTLFDEYDIPSDIYVINNTILGNVNISKRVSPLSQTFSPKFHNTIIYSGVYSPNALTPPKIIIEDENISPVFHNCYIEQDSLDFSRKPQENYFSDTTYYKNNITLIDCRLDLSGNNPMKNSPCIDMGANAYYLSLITNSDILGNSRIKRTIDIGAIESQCDTVFPNILSQIPAKYTCGIDSLYIILETRGDSLLYKWYLNDVLLPSFISDTLLIYPIINTNYNGAFKAVISNQFGSDSLIINHYYLNDITSIEDTIYGENTLMHCERYSFFIDPITNSNTYEWICSEGIKIINTSIDKRTVTIEVSDSISQGYLKVRGKNSCSFSQFFTKHFIVDSIPSTIGGFIYYSDTLCVNQDYVFAHTFGSDFLDNKLQHEWIAPEGVTIQWTREGVIGGTVGENAISGDFKVRWYREGYGEGSWSIYPVSILQKVLMDVNIITGLTTVCQNQDSVTYIVPAIENATSYIWTLPSGAAGTSLTNNITVNFGLEALSGEISVKGLNECGEGELSILFIQVNSIPVQPSAIQGSTFPIIGSSQVYAVDNVEGVYFEWQVPSGTSIVDGQGTHTITVVVGSNTGILKVTPSNACGSGIPESLYFSPVCSSPWTPIPNLQFNMQVLAQIMIDDAVSSNINDVLGAFVGDECRGIASPLEGLSMAFLSVGSNQGSGELVELKIWNSALCEFCDAGPGFTFVNLGEIGTFDNPLQVSCITDVDLNFTFGQGYTWFSQNLALENPHPNAFFEGLEACNNDRLISQSSFSVYQNGNWNGTIVTMNPANSYRLKICAAKAFTASAPPAEIVPIVLNSGYTWMGYLPQTCLPVNVALANMDPAPSANDRLIGQGSFALYNGSQWMGSLTTLCPGTGYVIKLANSTTLVYPEASATAKGFNSLEAELNSPTGINPVKSLQHSMTVLGQLELPGGQYSNNAEDRVYAFANGLCVGMANPMETENGLIFLSVGENSDEAQQVSFKIWLDAEKQLYEANEILTFVPLKGTGAYENPFKFTLRQPVNSENDWFFGEPYPNPFNDETVVPVYLNEPSTLVLKLYNTMGQIVYTTEKSFNTAGKHEFLLKKEQLNAGVYSLSIIILNQTQFLSKSKKLIIN